MKRVLTAVLALLTMIFLPSGLPIWAMGWNQTIIVQNIGVDAPAQTTVSFFDPAGNLLGSRESSIPAQGMDLFNPLGTPGLNQGDYWSSLVESDQPVVVATRQAYYNGERYTSAHGYNGQFEGTLRLYYPLLNPGCTAVADWSVHIQVTNVGDAPATVTTTFYNPDGSPAAIPIQTLLPPHGSAYFDRPDSLGTDFQGSAEVVSDQPLIGNLVQQCGDRTAAYDAATGSTAETGQWYLPAVYGPAMDDRQTVIGLQNSGQTSLTAQVEFHDQNGLLAHQSQRTIPPLGSQFIRVNDLELPPGQQYSVQIQSDGELCAGQTDSRSDGRMTAVPACHPCPGGNVLTGARSNYNSSYTLVNIRNTGASANTIFLHLVNVDGSTALDTSLVLDPYQSRSVDLTDLLGPEEPFNGSVWVEASNVACTMTLYNDD